MGSKNKLKRFKENESFANVIQPTREALLNKTFTHKGTWETYFGNANPIVLELGCGKGEYTVELARKNPKFPSPIPKLPSVIVNQSVTNRYHQHQLGTLDAERRSATNSPEKLDQASVRTDSRWLYLTAWKAALAKKAVRARR